MSSFTRNKADQAQSEITYVKDCMHILDCAMRYKDAWNRA